MQPVSFFSLVSLRLHPLIRRYLRMEPACLVRNRDRKTLPRQLSKDTQVGARNLDLQKALTGPANNENRNAAGLRSLAART
jgi:hypothetical protein